ncbi:Protein THEM6 [Frankliniella fusca]|uniref:Protein THEM6 n=1 Tax=Frankliniella fusca TaxID=407009 RepID=A0AAE1HME4_9NEOP|nr:Protein THEM6 [Frankliniella fusca]
MKFYFVLLKHQRIETYYGLNLPAGTTPVSGDCSLNAAEAVVVVRHLDSGLDYARASFYALDSEKKLVGAGQGGAAQGRPCPELAMVVLHECDEDRECTYAAGRRDVDGARCGAGMRWYGNLNPLSHLLYPYNVQ